MTNKLANIMLAATAATVLLAWPVTDLVAQTEGATKPNVVTKTTGHPEKQTAPVAVHQTTKPKPAPKAEKVPKATKANSSWVPGDYYWDGNGWQWDGGYWIDRPWTDAVWIPGHWSDRWWGWTWVPGYWF
jgi:hypothetical protein